MEPKQLYSPNQVLGGALWGGPIAAIYFLHSNYIALGKADKAQKTLMWGALLVVALLLILPLLPEGFPGIGIPVAYSVIAQQISATTQLGKKEIAESEDYKFASNWGVFGLATLSLLIFVIAAVVVMMLMEFMGVIVLE